MYYPSSENKGADQLRDYREADLRLCFCICRLLVFPWDGSNDDLYSEKHHLKELFKEMQFVAFFIFHMEKTRMQVKNDLRCLRQIMYQCTAQPHYNAPHYSAVFNTTRPGHGSQIDYFAI